MTTTDIYPFGQNEEMPAGYPVADNLTTNSAQQALSAKQGVILAGMVNGRKTIRVAANDATSAEKLAADYQCTGANDELVLQQAINEIYTQGGGTLRLSSGTFMIDSFPNSVTDEDGGGNVAILIPSNDTTGYNINICGEMQPYGLVSGTLIKVSDTCYESLNSNQQYKIFSARYSSSLIGKANVSIFMSNFQIRLPWNQKKILCINLRSCNRVRLQFVTCYGYTNGYGGWSSANGNPPAKAVEGCIGIRMTSGSNYGTICDYLNCGCHGFYEAWQVGGEHVVGINLSGVFNVYSYTFGNYPWTEAFHHPITLINCCDERSVNMPLFAYCGANRGNGEGGQQITMIDFNFERYAPQTPGGQIGEWATEIKPGTFHGEITYTTQRAGSNVVDIPFWKDGHGQRFITRNSAHRLACSQSVRNSYAPNYLQRIWDTTNNKEVICVDTANKVWVDAMGNIV